MITVKQLLQRPVFQNANLIGGKRGILKKVGWVHVLEISTSASAPFTNEHDLILTTGIGLGQKLETGLNYMKALIQQGAAGVCIELGEFVPRIPDEMIALADEADFPLIVFTKTVRFVDITQDVHGLLINKQHQMLKDLDVYSRKLQQLSLQTTDVYPILKLLHDQTSLQVFFFSDVEECRFVPHISQETMKQFVSYYQQVQWNDQDSSFVERLGRKKVIAQPIRCFGQTLAHLCLSYYEESEYMSLLLDYTGKAISHLLLRTIFIEEKRFREHNELLESLMKGESGREDEILQQIGLPPSNKDGYIYVGGVVEIERKLGDENDIVNQDALLMLRSLFKKHHLFVLLMHKNNAIYIFVVKEVFSSETYEKLKRTIDSIVQSFSSFVPQNKVHVGFGRAKKKIGLVKDSFQEAFHTLGVTRVKSVRPFYDELGIYQIIKGVEKEETLQSFVHIHLNELIVYDEKNNTELLKTLDVLLQCNGSKQEAAKKLFIHRQTLYHRLERLEELLGEGYLESDKRLCLEIALRILEIYKMNSMVKNE